MSSSRMAILSPVLFTSTRIKSSGSAGRSWSFSAAHTFIDSAVADIGNRSVQYV